jgi:hypothetical protein
VHHPSTLVHWWVLVHPGQWCVVRVCNVVGKFQFYILDKGYIEMLGFVIVLASSGLRSQLGSCDI